LVANAEKFIANRSPPLPTKDVRPAAFRIELLTPQVAENERQHRVHQSRVPAELDNATATPPEILRDANWHQKCCPGKIISAATFRSIASSKQP
jgi:hypothetical protein